MPIYAVSRDATVAQIVKGYGANLDQNGNYYPRFLFLLDGRCSVLFWGHEVGLATPDEDMLHLHVLQALSAHHKAVLNLDGNADCGNGVLQDKLDNRINKILKVGPILFE